MTKRKENPQKAGRHSDYKPEMCLTVHRMAQAGATDMEIAQALDISSASFYRYAAAHPEFREALVLGKESSDDRVERSLFHRAVGYSYESIKIMQYEGRPVIVPYTEHVPPDPGCAIRWLSSRRPKEWRERKEVMIGEFKNFSDEELKAELDRLEDAEKAAAEAEAAIKKASEVG